MRCKKCGSLNIKCQVVTSTEIKRRGFFKWCLWILFAMCTFGLILLIPLLTNSKLKNKHETMYICQDCGHTFE